MGDTRLAIQTQIIEEIGGRTDVNSIIQDQINFAVQEISTMYEHQELKTSATWPTEADTAEYTISTIASDYYAPVGVYDETNDRELEHNEKWHYEEEDETNTGTGGPTQYAIYGDSIFIWDQIPEDDSITMRLDYWKYHPELTLDTSEILFGLDWNRGVRLLASAYVHRILDMDEKANARQAEFDRWISRKFTPKAKEEVAARDSRVIWTRGY